MKQDALRLAASVTDPALKLNLLREYLQACALRSLHEADAFLNLSFVGGTALRFLFQLPRFSEDLDFSLELPENYAPEPWLAKMKRDFGYLGFAADITWNDRKTVNVAWIKVASLLMEAGISKRSDQKLAIKIEIDTRPPEGAVVEKRVLNRYVFFAVRHHDLSSLMAGKVRALLTRPFQKGRDWYDLLWYLAQVPPVQPNPVLLSNALAQPGDVNLYRPDLGWKGSLRSILDTLDSGALRDDVAVFLEHPRDADLLTAEHFRQLLN